MSDQSSEILITILGKLVNELSQARKKELAKEGYDDLSLSLFKYVNAIAELGAPTPSDIAAYFEITKPAVTGNVDKLVAVGLVKKEQSNEDRRVSFLVPTSEGRKIAAAFGKANITFVEKIKGNLSESEFEQLIQILRKIE